MRYKLILTTDAGIVLNEWHISTDSADSGMDVVAPIRKFGAALLVEEINSEIAKDEERERRGGN